MRNSALALCVYFMVGLILLLSLLSFQKKQLA